MSDPNFKTDIEVEDYAKRYVETGKGCRLCADNKRLYWNPMAGRWVHERQHQLGEQQVCRREGVNDEGFSLR